MSNDALLEAFNHDHWANRELLRFCGDLSDEQLSAPGSATYGTILQTFSHIVIGDARYVSRLLNRWPDWASPSGDDDPVIPLSQLEQYADESHALWNQLLSEPFDPERVVYVDNGEYGVRAGILVAQALHHGNAHREQISAILSSLGKEPPDIQAWAYAEATGRIWEEKKGAAPTPEPTAGA